ncbi:MAG: radical SAM protein [Gammaproteobacteria bacterium]|nr:radical SAM protein [Gammaproteobacteria bacterium]
MTMGSLQTHIQPLVNLLQKKPLLAIFEINLQCNSKCGYCDLPLNQGRYELSRTEIKSIFTDLYHNGLRYVFIQGGEPTLRKDLLEIIGDLHQTGLKLSLITNGTRLTEQFIEALAQYPVDLSISLDTLDRDLYRKIRGADQLKLVLAGLQRLQDYPHPKYITCIVSAQNRNKVLEVVRFARQSGFMPVVGAYHWDIERYGKVDPELQYENSQARAVFEEVIESNLVPRGYFRNYLEDNVRWLSGDKLNACDAGRYSIAIDASGNVAGCLAMSHAGNLREQKLSTILANMDFEKIDNCSNQSSCNMMCSRVIGSNLRQPISAILTPVRLEEETIA